jgi:hypothetical protein
MSTENTETDLLLSERRAIIGRPEEWDADDVQAFLRLSRKLERERNDWMDKTIDALAKVGEITQERDDYKAHFEACEAQRQRQIAECDELRAEVRHLEFAKNPIECKNGHRFFAAVTHPAKSEREWYCPSCVVKENAELRAEVERLKSDKAQILAQFQRVVSYWLPPAMKGDA